MHTETEEIEKHRSQVDLGPSVSQVADILEDARY
jgi:hypothetical protein